MGPRVHTYIKSNCLAEKRGSEGETKTEHGGRAMGVTLMRVDLACDQQFHKHLGPSAKSFKTRAMNGLVQNLLVAGQCAGTSSP